MILQIEELTKQFGGLSAVNNVSLGVRQNEILGIIGPNGAGKSTLLNSISGFDPATSGKIIFEGRDITGLKSHKIARLGIGRNFQASVLFMSLPVIDNIFLAFHMGYETGIWKSLLHMPSAVREEKKILHEGGEILDKMGLGPFKNELTKNLPHGYQRILGICIGLATKPKLLLLDEPMTGMNQNEIQTMLSLIRWIRDKGITIMMIEHNVSAVTSLCDRIVVLDHGRKIAEGLPEEIRENERVIEAYLGKE